MKNKKNIYNNISMGVHRIYKKNKWRNEKKQK